MNPENKKAIRKRYIALRDGLSPAEIEGKSEKIIKTLLESAEYKACDKIFTYINMRSEVITVSFIQACIKDKKKVAVPKVWPDGSMTFIDISGANGFETTPLGTSEPVSGEELEADENSLIIVPGTAFDTRRNRIGYGKGFYDRFLSESGAKNIALAYDLQIADALPVEKFDVPVQKIITESRVL